MIKITKGSEPIKVEHVVVGLFGQPGVGKTSTAFTASKPLLLDFDGGAYRSGFRKDTIQVRSWPDVESITADDVSGYDTIVVDTVGRLLDSLSVDLIAHNPKMKGAGGALSLQGYGALKSVYSQWLKTLLSFRKDVVLIAHDKEDKKGDDLIVRPDVQGSSLGEVVKRCDGLGYMHKVGRDTVIDWAPSDSWLGKDVACLGTQLIPRFEQHPDWFASVLAGIKGSLNTLSAEQTQAVEEVETWRAYINDSESADSINGIIAELGELKGPALAQVKALIAARAKSLGLTYDKAAKAYMEAAA